jgi:hypothetical protein
MPHPYLVTISIIAMKETTVAMRHISDASLPGLDIKGAFGSHQHPSNMGASALQFFRHDGSDHIPSPIPIMHLFAMARGETVFVDPHI